MAETEEEDKGIESWEKMRRAGLLHIPGSVGTDNVFQPGAGCSAEDAARVQAVLNAPLQNVQDSPQEVRRKEIAALGTTEDILAIVLDELAASDPITPAFAELVNRRKGSKK